MTHRNCLLVGAPVDSGKQRRGCLMGPDAYRTAGLAETLADLGHSVRDIGNITPVPFDAASSRRASSPKRAGSARLAHDPKV